MESFANRYQDKINQYVEIRDLLVDTYNKPTKEGNDKQNTYINEMEEIRETILKSECTFLGIVDNDANKKLADEKFINALSIKLWNKS